MTNQEEAERLFLSEALHDNAILHETFLVPEMFDCYRHIAERIFALSKLGRVSIDTLIAIASELDPRQIAQLDPYTSTNWRLYQDAIYSAWADGLVKTSFRLAATQGYREAIDTAEHVITSISIRQHSAQTTTIGSLIGNALNRIEARIQNRGEIPGISFGMERIDRATLGAQKEQLIVIAGRPACGKSAFMAQVARRQAKDHRVGIISIESSEVELMQRILIQESQIDGRKIQAGLLTNAEMGTLADAAKCLELIQDELLIHGQPGIRFQQLASVARRMVRDGVKILYVDYLQIVRMPGKEKRAEEVSDVTTSLKALAMELKIPIVALAQLGRDTDSRRPTMGDCQHSSQIEQDADQVWLIWHRSDVNGGLIDSRIILDKVRDGQVRDVFVEFDRPILRFTEKASRQKETV